MFLQVCLTCLQSRITGDCVMSASPLPDFQLTLWVRLIFLHICHLEYFNSVINKRILIEYVLTDCRSQWPRGLRRRSAAARLLRSWVRIPPEAWMFVCCECCVLSDRGLCDKLITRPEEFYQLWYVVFVCDL